MFTSRKRHSSVASCLATRSWSQHCGTGATRYSLNNSNAAFQRSDNPPSFPCVARLLAVLPHATLCLTKLLPLALRVNKFPPTRLLATFAFGDEYVFANSQAIGNFQKKTGIVKITTKCRLTFWKKCEISCQREQKASLLALCRVPPRLREAKDCLHVYLIGRLAILAVRNPHLCDLLLQVLPIKFHLIPQHPKIKRKHFVSRE